MPKKTIDYSKCSIYKIQHDERDDLIYIGHTTNFTKRKYHHKSNCNNVKNKKNNLKLYNMMRENGGWNEFKMIELYKFSCSDRREAEAEEDKAMREYKCSMNSSRAFITIDEKIERQKQYKIDNILKIILRLNHIEV